MGARYWVGGGGMWSDTSHWSLTQGGPGGADLPTRNDSVHFTNESFPFADATVQWDNYPEFGNFFSDDNIVNKPKLLCQYQVVYCYGNAFDTRGIESILGSFTFYFFPSDHFYFNTNRMPFEAYCNFSPMSPDLELNLSSDFLLNSSLFCSGMNFKTNGHDFDIMEIVMYSGTLDLSNGSHVVGNMALQDGVVVVPNQQPLTCITAQFSGGSAIWGDVVFDTMGRVGMSTVVIQGTNTFKSITQENGAGLYFQNDQIIQDSFNVSSPNGAPFARIYGGISGAQITLTSQGTFAVDNVTFEGIIFNGPAEDVDFSARNIGDAGFNENMLFRPARTLYWIDGPGNWSDYLHWSETSGGVPTDFMPLAQDHLVFDQNQGIESSIPFVCDILECSSVYGMDMKNSVVIQWNGYQPLRVHGSFELRPSSSRYANAYVIMDRAGTFNIGESPIYRFEASPPIDSSVSLACMATFGLALEHLNGTLSFDTPRFKTASYNGNALTYGSKLFMNDCEMTISNPGSAAQFYISSQAYWSLTIFPGESTVIFDITPGSFGFMSNPGKPLNHIRINSTNGNGAAFNMSFQDAFSCKIFTCLAPGANINFPIFQTVEAETFNVQGSVAAPIKLGFQYQGSTVWWGIRKKTTGQVEMLNVSVRNSRAEEDYVFFAPPPSIDGGDNLNWRFTNAEVRPVPAGLNALMFGSL